MKLNSTEIEVINNALIFKKGKLLKLRTGYKKMSDDPEDGTLEYYIKTRITGLDERISVIDGVLEKLKDEVI